MNYGIDPQVCAVTYTSFDAAVSWVKKYGRGSLMAKTKMLNWLSGSFLVHPQSFQLLGCCWQGSYFVDHCLPMGCSISCALFEAFSLFFEWTVREVAGVDLVIHYLDDLLCIGPSESRSCRILLGKLQPLAERFGIPLAADKTEGPTSELIFLEITIDSVAMEC